MEHFIPSFLPSCLHYRHIINIASNCHSKQLNEAIKEIPSSFVLGTTIKTLLWCFPLQLNVHAVQNLRHGEGPLGSIIWHKPSILCNFHVFDLFLFDNIPFCWRSSGKADQCILHFQIHMGWSIIEFWSYKLSHQKWRGRCIGRYH